MMAIIQSICLWKQPRFRPIMSMASGAAQLQSEVQVSRQASSVLTWLRAMGDDDNEDAHIGEWVYGCPKSLAHPLPLRFAIGGDNVPEGVAIGELKVTSGSNPVRRRSPGDTTIQGLIRNRSKQTVTSYSVAYSVDGGAAQTKGFVTDLAPNETETIEITLNGISTGEHTIKMDVVEVNSGVNVLSNQNSPSMIVNEGAQLEYVNVSISSIGKLAYSSRYALDFSDVEGLKAFLTAITTTSCMGHGPVYF